MPVPSQLPPSWQSRHAHIHLPALSPHRDPASQGHPSPATLFRILMTVKFYIKTEPRMSIWGADFSKQQYQARPFFCLFTFLDVSSYLHGPRQVPQCTRASS